MAASKEQKETQDLQAKVSSAKTTSATMSNAKAPNPPNLPKTFQRQEDSSRSPRTKIQGRFAFEGVSFGYVYWKPKSGTHAFRESGVSSHSVLGEAKASLPDIANEAKPSLTVISSEAKRSREISSAEAEGARAQTSLSTSVLLPYLPGYSGTTPLVLVHGFGQSAKSWEPVVACLDPERPVWAFELLGHGASDRPSCEDAYDLDFQGRALVAFLEAISIETVPSYTQAPKTAQDLVSVPKSPQAPTLAPVRQASQTLQAPVLAPAAQKTPSQNLTLVGYSMGGRVVLSAMTQSERFARAVSNVVLESAGLGALSEEIRTEAARKDALHAAKLRAEGLEAFFDYWEALPLFASQKTLPFEIRQAIREERLANDPEALAATFERAGQHCMPLREEVYERLRRVQAFGVNIAYLAGEKDAKYVSLTQEAARAINLSVTIVPSCGHNIHSELAVVNS